MRRRKLEKRICLISSLVFISIQIAVAFEPADALAKSLKSVEKPVLKQHTSSLHLASGAIESIPLKIGNQRQIFIDDFLVGSMHNLTRVLHSPARHRDNPLIVGDRPWEQWVIEVNGRSVVYDEKAGEFRMYYLAPEMDPSAPYGERFRACLATSRDGLNWERPNLGQLEWKGSRLNNLLRYGENWMRRPNVIIDSADPDPARRYKMTYVDFFDGRTAITKGHSRDGIQWHLNADGKPWFRQRHNSNLLGWDPRIRQYVLYPRMTGAPNAIGRSTSQDFITWTEPEVMLVPEPADEGNNFTALAAFIYEGVYLGLLSVSNSLRNIRHAELVISRDGILWRRVAPRYHYFPHGAPGTWESDAVVPVAPVVHDGRIWIYYTGWNLPYSKEALTRAHKGWFENGQRKQRAIGLATLRLDGFASINAGREQGTLVTKPLQVTGKSLLLNARVHDELRVEILDTNDRPIPGYTVKECRRISSDNLSHVVRWRGRQSLEQLAGKSIKLRFLMTNGDLYAFKFE
jgi:hypothetical protein